MEPEENWNFEISKEQVDRLDKQLTQNKSQMLRILKQSWRIGVYAHQTEEIFYKQFFPSYINFLKSQIGPRGDCSRQIRKQMADNPEFYDQLLKPLNLKHNSHIKDIYTKYKLYVPCKQYTQLLKLQETLQKSSQSYEKILDPQSIMSIKIKEGMLQKRGPQFDYKEQIKNIQQNYKNKIQKLSSDRKQLLQIVNNNENCIKYFRIKQHMKEKQYFKKWREADSQIGLESCIKGNSFEEKVQKQIMPIIIQRAGIDTKNTKFQVLVNCRWVPRNLGEIDIAIAEYNKQKDEWIATIFIQCKSRLFDIREAYKQVAILKTQDFDKDKLSTKLGIISVHDKHQHFIVTTLPDRPFNLPIQSKMKQSVEKCSKNKTMQQIEANSSELYSYLRNRFKEELSPLDWFLQNDSDHLIVLKA